MFQLVFKGECAPGTDRPTAQRNAQALFKASAEQLERMFSGNPVVIRNKLDQQQAEKYRAVLNKHGMVAYVQPMPTSQPQAQPAPAHAPGTRARAAEKPAGPATGVQPRDAAPEVEPGDRLPVAGDKVDEILAGSGLGLDPVGVNLVQPQEVEPPMFQNLQDWTLAPAGSDIGVERDLPPAMVPDVSHLSLTDEAPDRQ